MSMTCTTLMSHALSVVCYLLFGGSVASIRGRQWFITSPSAILKTFVFYYFRRGNGFDNSLKSWVAVCDSLYVDNIIYFIWICDFFFKAGIFYVFKDTFMGSFVFTLIGSFLHCPLSAATVSPTPPPCWAVLLRSMHVWPGLLLA